MTMNECAQHDDIHLLSKYTHLNCCGQCYLSGWSIYIDLVFFNNLNDLFCKVLCHHKMELLYSYFERPKRISLHRQNNQST